jgi:hypothetical protein
MGVRDALRMVDSFNKWAQRNPGRAKSLDDFIHDGLIAAAMRCESCLKEKLGLTFVESVHDEEAVDAVDSEGIETTPLPDTDNTHEEVPVEPPQTPPDSDFEVSVESKDSGSDEEVTIESEEPLFSLDAVERLEDETLEDLDIEGPQRDFSSDFELVEPSPLVVSPDDAKSDDTKIEVPLDDTSLEDIDESFESEPALDDQPPAFTWSDYEAAVAPSREPEPSEGDFEEHYETSDEYADESTKEDDTFQEDVVEEPMPPPDMSKMWDSDDSATPSNEDEFSDSKPDAEESETEEKPAHFTEPPSPPPPPEGEEDEEERKRRARRLFFGT